MSLEELLERVAVPRAGGSEALRGVGAFIEELLRTHSPEVSIQPFVGTPYGIGILMGVSLALALTFATAVWFDRYGLALGAVLAVALLGLLEMELLLPAVSWPARAPETNIVATFPGEPGGSTLVFAAHYDTATQFGDHLSWSLWGSLTLAAQGLALVLAAIGVFRRRTGNGLPRVLAIPLSILCVVPVAVMAWFHTAGPLIRDSSPGALDNGGSVVALLALAERLSTRPEDAPMTVKLAFLAGEEERTLGSMAYAASLRDPERTAVINLELLGGSERFAYVAEEGFAIRRFAPSPELIELVRNVVRERWGEELAPRSVPNFSYTDARSFLAVGIPSMTLMAYFDAGFPRSLHSPLDTTDRVSAAAVERGVDLLEAIVRRVDARGLPLVGGVDPHAGQAAREKPPVGAIVESAAIVWNPRFSVELSPALAYDLHWVGCGNGGIHASHRRGHEPLDPGSGSCQLFGPGGSVSRHLRAPKRVARLAAWRGCVTGSVPTG